MHSVVFQKLIYDNKQRRLKWRIHSDSIQVDFESDIICR